MTVLAAAKGSFVTSNERELQSIAGLGFQPAAVVAWWGRLPTAGTKRGNRGGVGFWTANDSLSVSWASADGESVTRTAHLGDHAALLGLDEVDAGIAMRAHIESLDHDGFTLRYATRPAQPWMVCFLALGGPAVSSARVGWTPPGSRPPSNRSKSVDRPGLVLLVPAPGESGIVGRGLAIGLGAKSSWGRAVAAGYLCPDGAEPGSATGSQRSGTAFLDWPGDWAESNRFCYLQVQGLHARIGTDVSPAGHGSRYTRVGFRPDALLLFSWGLRPSPMWNTMGRFCLGAASGNQCGCVSWDDRDGDPSETMTHVRSSTEHVLIVADSQSDNLHAQASLGSIDDEGFTLDWLSDKPGREFAYVALSGQDTRGLAARIVDRITRLR